MSKNPWFLVLYTWLIYRSKIDTIVHVSWTMFPRSCSFSLFCICWIAALADWSRISFEFWKINCHGSFNFFLIPAEKASVHYPSFIKRWMIFFSCWIVSVMFIIFQWFYQAALLFMQLNKTIFKTYSASNIISNTLPHLL